MRTLRKKGQIGLEIMYAVGVLLVIFIMLSGVTFERNKTLKKTQDYEQKINHCVHISNKLTSIAALGDGHSTTFKTRYRFSVYETGLVQVSDSDSQSLKIDAYCTYTGALDQANYSNNTGTWKITGVSGQLTLEQT